MSVATNQNATAPKIEDFGVEAWQATEKPVKRVTVEELKPQSDINGSLSVDSFNNELIEKMKRICECESSLDETAICYTGWQGGMGLCGFISGTWNYTLKLMEKDDIIIPEKCAVRFESFDRSHPIFDRECNFLLALYLIRKEGDRHWSPSKHCWGIKVVNHNINQLTYINMEEETTTPEEETTEEAGEVEVTTEGQEGEVTEETTTPEVEQTVEGDEAEVTTEGEQTPTE